MAYMPPGAPREPMGDNGWRGKRNKSKYERSLEAQWAAADRRTIALIVIATVGIGVFLGAAIAFVLWLIG